MQTVSQNPLFQKFMGIKYLVTKNSGEPADGVFSVHRQEHAAPVIYATDQVISEDTYRKLEFPYNQTTLAQYAVAKDGRRAEKTKITASVPDIQETAIQIPESASVCKTDKGYTVQTNKTEKTSLFVTGRDTNAQKEQLFFLQFDEIGRAHV